LTASTVPTVPERVVGYSVAVYAYATGAAKTTKKAPIAALKNTVPCLRFFPTTSSPLFLLMLVVKIIRFILEKNYRF